MTKTGGYNPRRIRTVWLVVVLVLFAFNLRLIFPSLSVLLPSVRQSLGLSATGVSVLTMLPVLCLGVFSPLAPWCARHAGIEKTLLGVLVVLASGTALRGVWGNWGMFLGSILAGGAIALANVLLPALVKRDFSRHIASVTALYTMALNIGASVAAATTVPVVMAVGAGDWRVGMMMWAVPPALAACVWWGVHRRRNHRNHDTASARVSLWRSPLAWQVTLFMGLQSATAYCVTGWLAPILQSRGLDSTTAGIMTSVCILMNALGSLVVPQFLRFFRDQRGINIVLSMLTGGGLIAILWAPVASLWGWVILQGVAQGGMFALALTVIVLRSPNPHVAAQLSSMAQALGYMLAAGGPLLVGLIFGWSGYFGASAWLFLAIIAAASVTGWLAGRARWVHCGEEVAP